jgi:hypothetical protein
MACIEYLAFVEFGTLPDIKHYGLLVANQGSSGQWLDEGVTALSSGQQIDYKEC